MPFVETLAPFFADFGVAGTLDGADVTGILDTQSVVESADGVLTQMPTFELSAAAAADAAADSVLVVAGVTYSVRQVRLQPPDGVLTQLVLART